MSNVTLTTSATENQPQLPTPTIATNPQDTNVVIPMRSHPVIQDLTDKHEENASKIDKAAAQINQWGQLLSTPAGKIIGGAALALIVYISSSLTAWINDKMTPKAPPADPPAKVSPAQPVNIVVNPPVPVALPAASPIVPPSPVASPVVPAFKLIVYVTPQTDQKGLAALKPSLAAQGVTLVVDAGPNNVPRSRYPFKDGFVTLPCMVLTAPDGSVLDVQPFTVAADVLGMIAKHGEKR